MKKTILMIVLLISAICSRGQNKAQWETESRPDTAKTSKAKYNYFVKVPVQDYQQLANALNEYKRLSIYDPQVSDAQKVQLFKNIESYLKELPGRLKLDSVKTK